MNDDDKVIDLSAERDKRIHDVHEKRLQEVRKAFEQVLPASLATSGGEDPPLLHAPFEPDLPPGVPPAMNDDDKVIDLSAERDKRIHDVHEKRLQEVRKAFEQVLPLGKPRKKPKGKPKKR